MVKVSFIEFFIRGIPESCLFVLASYAFTETSVNMKKYMISSILMAIVGFIARSLPIHYGVHIVLNIFAFIIIITNINKIDLIKSIKVSISILILQFLCELLNMLLIQSIFGSETESIFSNGVTKTIYGIPSTIVFGIIIIIYYRLVHKKRM